MGILVLFLASSLTSFAQEVQSKLNLGAEFSNIHVWRGQISVDSECIKPSIEYNKSNFTIGAWGLYTTDNSYAEIDLYLAYKMGNWSFMAYDFYMPSKAKRFFDYSKESNIHMFDFTATYKISDKFPLSAMLAATYSKKENNMNKEEIAKMGELSALSTYLELSYPTKLGNTDIKYLLAVAPGNSRYSRYFDEEGNKHYSDGAIYLTNIGLDIAHKIKITDTFSLPISAVLTFNPHQEKMYLQFNISLSN